MNGEIDFRPNLLSRRKRLRYTRNGWHHLTRMNVGTIDYRTGIHLPDKRGLTALEIVSGPYSTADNAIAAAW